MSRIKPQQRRDAAILARLIPRPMLIDCAACDVATDPSRAAREGAAPYLLGLLQVSLYGLGACVASLCEEHRAVVVGLLKERKS